MATKKSKKISPKQVLELLVVGLVFFFVGLVYALLSPTLNRYFAENPSTNQTKIPRDVAQTLKYASPSATFRVPVLMYHYIEYVKDKGDTIRESLNIQPYAFDLQVKTLKENGFTFMTAKELGDVLNGKRNMPKKPLLLTFDDGHWDFVTDILPILEKYNAKATQYIVPGMLGGKDFMTKEQVQTAIDSKIVEIGAHTVHHVALKGRETKNMQYEVEESKKMLEDWYHIKVVSFAYPYGSFDQQAIDEVKKAGFSTAVTTLPGQNVNQNNRFFIYRIRPGYRTGQDLIKYLENYQGAPK